MEPLTLASIIVSIALGSAFLVGAAMVASAIRRRPQPPAATTATDEGVAAALARLERRIRRLEKATRRRARTTDDAARPADASAAVTIEPRPFTPDLAASSRIAPEPHHEPRTNAKIRAERSPQWAEEIRRLAQRGRNPVEIAQLVDADVGEVELVLRLGHGSA